MAPRFIPLAALAAAVALAGSAAPALADDGMIHRTREVRTSDLDLTTEEGAARLKARIHTASRAVCGRADPRDLRELEQVDTCRAAALEQANHAADRLVMAARSGTRQAARGSAPTGAR